MSPLPSGYWNSIASGVIIFLEDGELTLECFPYGEVEIPADYRNHRVEITEFEFFPYGEVEIPSDYRNNRVEITEIEI